MPIIHKDKEVITTAEITETLGVKVDTKLLTKHGFHQVHAVRAGKYYPKEWLPQIIDAIIKQLTEVKEKL